MIRIITIEREYGSGASEIARELSNQIGWTLWDDLLTEQIARLARCRQSEVKLREERVDPLYYRLLKSFAIGSYEGGSFPPVETLDADSIVKISEQVVEEAYALGNCVIVGRGSQHFLRDRSDTLRFFLYSTRKEKVHRLVSEGKTSAEAEKLVDMVDDERSAFIKKYFHAEWPNRSIYHAMLNTSVGKEAVIQAILTFLPRV